MRGKKIAGPSAKGATWKQAAMLLLAAACLAASATACAGKRKKTVALSSVAYTYDAPHSLVYVNDQWAGGGSNGVELGDVDGGGGICCVRIERGARTARVKVEYGLTEVFEVDAPIEQPWPESPSRMAVHLLPGRKVVIELATLWTLPRSDLLVARLKEIGKWPVQIQAPHAWSTGPEGAAKNEVSDD